MAHWFRRLMTPRRVIAALTPTVDTKAAYIGEFTFSRSFVGDDGNDVVETHTVPWTTIKDIMAAIRRNGGIDG